MVDALFADNDQLVEDILTNHHSRFVELYLKCKQGVDSNLQFTAKLKVIDDPVSLRITNGHDLVTWWIQSVYQVSNHQPSCCVVGPF